MQKIPFLITIILIIILGTATFIEKKQGSNFVSGHIYGSWWFAGIWFIAALFSILGIIKGKIYKNIPLFLMHISFIVILAGALFTKVTAKHGYTVLDKHIKSNVIHTDLGPEILPFEMVLDTFFIDFYPGTDAPADYISHIRVIDSFPDENISGQISMNRIFSYEGYRFYQSSYDNDGNTSILSINRDIWGIPVTYGGYALFMLSMLWYLLSPRNAYRKLFSHPLLKGTSIILLFLLPASASGNVFSKDSLSINKQQAREFGKLWMLYEGRMAPINVFAHDFTLKLTGKPSISHLDANQFLMGFLFFPEKWQRVMFIEVKNPILQKELKTGNNKACLNDFFDEKGNYIFEKYRKDLISGHKSPILKEVQRLDEKIQLVHMLQTGTPLQLYPTKYTDHGNEVRWFSPTDRLPATFDSKTVDFIRKSLLDYYQAVHENDEDKASGVINKIRDFQYTNAREVLPSDFQRDAEIYYIKTNPTSWLFKVNLTLGILSLIILYSGIKKQKILFNLFYILLIAGFLIQTASISVRSYLSGYLPFSNGFETMMIIAWCAMLPGIFLSRKINIVLPAGFLISGFSLLVAHLSMINPKITPLVPVLSSPLLSIHVSVIMLAYTLLAFAAFIGIISLIRVLITPRHKKELIYQFLERNKAYSLICLYPGLFLLGSGIFFGAIWANVSWGRYWGWDPKEVWALITFLIYSLVFHQKNIRILSDPFSFHCFGVIAFFSVLMTYFGVNYFLGGLHSYAGEMQSDFAWIGLISVIILIAGLIIAGHVKKLTIDN